MKARRLTWLQENGPCANCGSWTDLEVDHKDPEQKITHRVWSWKESRRLEELAKCQVLCYNCHKEKSNKERTIFNIKFQSDENGPLAKLTNAEALLIRKLYTTGLYSQRRLGKHFGITHAQINYIINNKSFKNI